MIVRELNQITDTFAKYPHVRAGTGALQELKSFISWVIHPVNAIFDETNQLSYYFGLDRLQKCEPSDSTIQKFQITKIPKFLTDLSSSKRNFKPYQ